MNHAGAERSEDGSQLQWYFIMGQGENNIENVNIVMDARGHQAQAPFMHRMKIPAAWDGLGAAMVDEKSLVEQAANLNQHAGVNHLQNRPEGPGKGGTPSRAEATATISELELHQIELEMQNDDLQRTREDLAAGRAPQLQMGHEPGEDPTLLDHGPGCGLTRREMETLCLVGRGFTSKQVAEALGIGARTVDSHRQKIMQKLAISNGPGLVKYAIEHGFVRNGTTRL